MAFAAMPALRHGLRRMALSRRPGAVRLASATAAAPLALTAAEATACAASQSSSGPSSTLKFEVNVAVAELAQRKGPLALLEVLIENGELREDPEQRRVVEYLNAVFHGAGKRTARGLYLYGSVGCGKTMSMDLFYAAVQGVHGLRVDRKHFHEFLHDVQVQLHQLKQEGVKANDGRGPVERVGGIIAKRTDVLCFDEFAVTTIQDCVLLMPLFSVLFEHGVLVVATSNRAPEDLYSDGLNRHLYLPPFLDLLRQHCKVHHLPTATDYRALHYENSEDAGVFCWPPDSAFVDRWFDLTTGGQGGAAASVDVSFGRSLDVPQLSACGRVARFSFGDLCRKFLSADDYLKLCRQFHTILLDDVPRLSVDDHNEARRFTTLIDMCYEHHVRLICSMDAPPEELLGGLRGLREMSLSEVGQGMAGCGDGDTAPSSSGVLQAIDRVKTSLANKAARDAAGGARPEASAPQRLAMNHVSATDVLTAEVGRVQAHGGADIDIWRQGGDSTPDPASKIAPPQVSKTWDDRRRISAFTWESQDPTSEQQTIKGVFTAAIASLKESGFAVDRAISRLREMQTDTFQENHCLKHLSVS